jgi:hypothetical protein
VKNLALGFDGYRHPIKTQSDCLIAGPVITVDCRWIIEIEKASFMLNASVAFVLPTFPFWFELLGCHWRMTCMPDSQYQAVFQHIYIIDMPGMAVKTQQQAGFNIRRTRSSVGVAH